VRFDGGHKRDPYLVDILGSFVRWVPICPEAGAGLGTPRETMQLTRRGDSIGVLGCHTGEDFTNRLQVFAIERVQALRDERLRGYVFKRLDPYPSELTLRSAI
jgi:uncharacterized protein YbbK (DUF523 family)